MPLDKETAAELTAQCRKAMKKELQFVYCLGGPDGDPVLVIDKNVGPKLKELKKTATKKKFARGTVTKGETGLEFRPEKPEGSFKKNLKNVFAKQVPLLKSASIVMDGARETDEDDAEELESKGADSGAQSAPTAPTAPPPIAKTDRAPAPAPDAEAKQAAPAGPPVPPEKVNKFTAALSGARPGTIPHDQLVQFQQQLAGDAKLVGSPIAKQVEAELQRRAKLVSRQDSLAKKLTSIREGHAKLEAELANAGDPTQVLSKLQERLTKLKELRDQFAAELR